MVLRPKANNSRAGVEARFWAKSLQSVARTRPRPWSQQRKRRAPIRNSVTPWSRMSSKFESRACMKACQQRQPYMTHPDVYEESEAFASFPVNHFSKFLESGSPASKVCSATRQVRTLGWLIPTYNISANEQGVPVVQVSMQDCQSRDRSLNEEGHQPCCRHMKTTQT